MSEMIERVAAALAAEQGYAWFVGAQEAEYALKTSQDGFRRRARAAIEAMREPTEAMVKAWINTAPILTDDSMSSWDAGKLQATADWQAMLSAALGEQGEG